MHPYELDTNELSVMKKEYGKIPLKWRITQFVGRNSIENKLHNLLNDFQFTSFERKYYSTESTSLPRNTLSNLEIEDAKTSKINPDRIVIETSYSS